MWSDWPIVCDYGFSLSALWCPLSAYCLIWVSLTLDVGYLFTVAPAKRSRCSLPPTWGSSSRPADNYLKATPSCPTLCDPMDISPPGSSIHGVLQAKILEWIPFSGGSSQPRDRTWVYCIAGRFSIWVTREALLIGYGKSNHRIICSNLRRWNRFPCIIKKCE